MDLLTQKGENSWGSTMVRKLQSSEEMLKVGEIAILKNKPPNLLSHTKWWIQIIISYTHTSKTKWTEQAVFISLCIYISYLIAVASVTFAVG